MPALLALDFDGVVCDAFDECALITWLGMHDLDPALTAPEHVRRLPADFVTRFRTVRDYARRLDHFVAAHQESAGHIRSQADFDALFSRLSPADTARFVTAASVARNRLQTTQPDSWLGMHTLYPGIDDLLRHHKGNVVIVTAKDEESVRAILDRHGLGHTVLEVHGECADKAAAVRASAARHGIAVDEVTFVDDNLDNVRQVAVTGARVLWARWGYHTPEHRAEAERAAVTAVDLDGLAAAVKEPS
ncbi:MAG: HAD family hydrolase [Kibdelosporangium sp.]